MRFFALILLFLSLTVISRAQNTAITRQDKIARSTVVDGDTLPYIQLREVRIFGASNAITSRFHQRQYWRLVYNLKKVIPYAKLVSATIRKVDNQLAQLKTDKERKSFIKNMEDTLWKQYEGDMRQMTISQGKLLFKLIDRETANSTYFWIESYRGSVSAFFWQGMARLFGTDLKSKYDPKGEDSLIEEIVTGIEKGII